MRIYFLALVFSIFIAANASAQLALNPVLDCSIASLSGSSQALRSVSNYQRKWLLVCNTGNATVGINWAGGTAVIAGASQNLPTGACKEFSINGGEPSPPPNPITVIGTAGQPLSCFEGK